MEHPKASATGESQGRIRLHLGHSPISLLLLVFALLFLLEAAVMLFLDWLDGMSSPFHVLLDSSLLVGLGFPAQYFFMFRPLSHHIMERSRAEKGLKQAHDELEQRIFDRTFELAAANKALQREAAERQLAEKEREALLTVVQQRAAVLDAIIGSITDGLVVYGPQGEVIRMNSAARKLLPLSPNGAAAGQEAAGSRITEDSKTGSAAPWDAPVERALRGETVDAVVAPLQSSTGETRHISISAGPVLAHDGKRMGAVVSLNDVTQLHDMHEWLQDVVRGVTHDLRTPLTAIWGHSQLLSVQATHNEKKWLRNVEIISQSARRLKFLTDDLADTVLLEAGQLEMQPEPVDLKDFLGLLLETNAPLIDVRRIRLDLPAGLPLVQADSNRLERIWMNLLTNALKYSPRQSEVVVKAEVSDTGLVLSVADQGTGMSPEELQHIFDRACKLRGSRQAGGLGLGLFITRNLVEAHRGRIWAESEEGKGSTFYFTLPTA